MASKYPIVLVHGLAVKDLGLFKAFGKIERKLKDAGYQVHTAKIDGFGSVKTNAEQLKECVVQILEREKAEKVNLIAHSKGGLDSRYMIENLNMGDSVASLTTLCTPHGGAKLATDLLNLPKIIVGILKVFFNGLYRLLGDKRPDALAVGRELSLREYDKDTDNLSQKIHCRSYSVSKDELVSQSSAAFANYMGNCLNEPLSHVGIIDLLPYGRKKRNRIYGFYITLCEELTALGY